MKDSQTDEGTLARYEQELRQIMHLLKIKYDGQIARAAFELIKKSNDFKMKQERSYLTINFNMQQTQ